MRDWKAELPLNKLLYSFESPESFISSEVINIRISDIYDFNFKKFRIGMEPWTDRSRSWDAGASKNLLNYSEHIR